MLGAGFGAVFQSDVPQIAYESDPEGNWDIFLLDLNTHLTHNLTRHPAADTQPAWSEATGKIAFVSNRNKAWLTAIYEMDRYGREVRMLKSGDLNYWRPAWSPDLHISHLPTLCSFFQTSTQPTITDSAFAKLSA